MKNSTEILTRLAVCAPEELQFRQAQEVALALSNRRWFKLLGCRRVPPQAAPSENESIIAICTSIDEVEAAAAAPEIRKPIQTPQSQDEMIEAIDFEVEIEVPQFPVHPIEEIERLTALFLRDQDGHVLILTLAARKDFPIVPHLYSDFGGLGRSLCLWDESSGELRLLWTAEKYFERVREWLRLSARGELHAPDQLLHPLFYRTRSYLVAPASLFAAEQATDASQSFGGIIKTVGGIETFLVRPEDRSSQSAFVAVAFNGAPLVQGIVEAPPRTLQELHEFAARLEIDFFQDLKQRLEQWHQGGTTYDSRIVFTFSFPQVRTLGGEPERLEQHAFTTSICIGELGEKLGFWTLNNVTGDAPVARLIQIDDGQWARVASQIQLVALNVTPLLSREMAVQLNGDAPVGDALAAPRVVAIGAGALGSQAFLNLARAGWGDWHIVDRDLLLPHNGARHALSGAFIGSAKVSSLCGVANSLFDESFRAKPLIGDVLTPSDDIKSAIENAEIVMDFSASVPAERALSHDFDVSGRCLSLFLNPSGTQLIVLAQDREKNWTLADLEMQMWRAIIEDPAWKNYFDADVSGDKAVRYGRSCGDKSSRIPQDLVACHAANASRAVRRITASSEAAISCWKFDKDTETQSREEVAVSPFRIWETGGWTLRSNEGVLSQLRQLRADRLPVETGGILLGTFDRDRQIAYLVSALPAPPDSEEKRSSFLRGCAGLREQVEAIRQSTGYQVDYLGEWHSHPPGRDSQPSRRDFEHFEHLKHERTQDGLPAVLLIVSENDEAVFVKTMPEPPVESPPLIILVLPR